MSDWGTIQAAQDRDIISADGRESVGTELVAMNQASTASVVWQAANLAVYIPFVVSGIFIAKQMRIENGATAAGNIDVGIYDNQKNRLVSMGSTAMSGTNAVQTFDITDTTLNLGVYYMAMSMSNASTALVRGWSLSAALENSLLFGAAGILEQALGSVTLPDPMVPVAYAASNSSLIPALVIMGRSVA